MGRTKLSVVFVLSIFRIAFLHAADLEEGVTYSYPHFYDNTDSLIAEDANEEKAQVPKNESPNAWHGKVGNAKITVDVENPDYISQLKAKREAKHKKDEPQKKRRSRFKQEEDDQENDKKRDGSPRASILIEWGKD